MTEARPGAMTHEVDLVELRVGLAGLTAEVQRMRGDLAHLAGLPAQLTAVAELQNERMLNLRDQHERDVKGLVDDITAESGRRRSADEGVERRLSAEIASVKEWQTWAIRLVLAFVVLAVLGFAIGTGAP